MIDDPSTAQDSPAPPRKRRDWRTPLLLTLSVHLMVFTLVVNHRLFSLIDDPKPGVHVTRVASISGEDPDDDEQDDDAGAAPGEDADDSEPARASVSDLLQEREVPVPTELPPRERSAPEPVEHDAETREEVPLSDRLAATAGAAGQGISVQGDAANPGQGAAGMRGEGRRQVGLRRHGGGADTENAVEAGLAWLASVQDHDGRWDSTGYMVHYLGRDSTLQQRMAEGVGFGRNDVAITALCLLAFTGAGYDGREGRYAGTVRRAQQWLMSRQRTRDGGFGIEEDRYRVTFYGHSLATLALADLHLLTGDQRLRTSVQRAVHYLARTQGAGGGWDYTQHYPGDESWAHSERDDLSITGWAILALSAARQGGIEIPDDMLRALVELLKRATRSDGEAIYANIGTRAGHRGMSMLAVSNLSRRLLGEPAGTDIQSRQVARMAGTPPNWGQAGELLGSNMYYWYYASLAMLVARDMPDGENRWREWNIALKRTLLPNQVKTGPRRGSFDPVGHWARVGGGRLYSTAICVLTLQVYYRYEPEYLRAKAQELADLWTQP
jgi:hypothetical protein